MTLHAPDLTWERFSVTFFFCLHRAELSSQRSSKCDYYGGNCLRREKWVRWIKNSDRKLLEGRLWLTCLVHPQGKKSAAAVVNACRSLEWLTDGTLPGFCRMVIGSCSANEHLTKPQWAVLISFLTWAPNYSYFCAIIIRHQYDHELGIWGTWF